MLFKAHRFCTGADLYNPAAHILKTLTRDKETHRVRELKSGDDTVTSIYDDIHHEGTSFFYGKLETLNSHEVKRAPGQSTIPRRLFYTEADALEDEILFPEENSSDGQPVLAVEKLRRWEEEGFSMMKFVEGWWTDSDEDSSEDNGEDEGESEDEDESEGENDGEDEDEEDEKNQNSENKKDYNYTDKIVGEILEQALDKKDGTLDPLATLPGALKELVDKLVPGFEKREKEEPNMEEEFMEFLDREKARGTFTHLMAFVSYNGINTSIVFKEVWHKADLEPQAQSHYIEMKEMARKSRKFNQRDFENPACLLTFRLIQWLDAFKDDARDLHKAIGKLAPFFYPEFLESKEGEGFKDSLLFKQGERAKHLPDIRSSIGNAHRPKEFWKEWDDVKKNMKDMKDLDETPAQWDTVARPIIAHCKLMLILLVPTYHQ